MKIHDIYMLGAFVYKQIHGQASRRGRGVAEQSDTEDDDNLAGRRWKSTSHGGRDARRETH
jgi:hypothetical protein